MTNKTKSVKKNAASLLTALYWERKKWDLIMLPDIVAFDKTSGRVK